MFNFFCFSFSGIFEFRVKSDDINGLRFLSFERLLHESCNEIQKNKI